MHGGEGGGGVETSTNLLQVIHILLTNTLASVQMNEYDTIYTCTLNSTMQYNVDFELKR